MKKKERLESLRTLLAVTAGHLTQTKTQMWYVAFLCVSLNAAILGAMMQTNGIPEHNVQPYLCIPSAIIATVTVFLLARLQSDQRKFRRRERRICHELQIINYLTRSSRRANSFWTNGATFLTLTVAAWASATAAYLLPPMAWKSRF